MERWTGLWALGAALLVAAGVFLFVPVVPDGPHTITPAVLVSRPPHDVYFLVENLSDYSITGTVPVSISWTSSAALYMVWAICSNHRYNLTLLEAGSNNVAGCQPWDYGPASGATIWTFSDNVPNGGAIVVAFDLTQLGPHSVNLTYTIWTGLTLASPVLFGAGVVSIALGVFLFMRALKPENPASKPQ